MSRSGPTVAAGERGSTTLLSCGRRKTPVEPPVEAVWERVFVYWTVLCIPPINVAAEVGITR
jgi:hypothetical protein